jgi:hypothetical protein
MLAHPTLDLLANLGLHGMIKGFQDLQAQPEAKALEHAEWLALLLDREIVNGGEVLERRAAKFWSTRAQRTSLAEATSDGPATEHLVAAV